MAGWLNGVGSPPFTSGADQQGAFVLIVANDQTPDCYAYSEQSKESDR